MKPFIRRVPSLEVTKQEGMDEHFFQGEDYIEVPSPAISVLYDWCKNNGAGNTALPSKEGISDEPLEVYYVKLGTEAGRDEFEAMMKALVPALVDSANKTALVLTAENFLTRQMDEASDNLAAIAAFRNALIRFRVKRPKSTGADPALIIEV